MKYSHNIIIALALVFLMLLVPSIGLVAAQKSDGGIHWMTWAPLNEAGAPQIWNGTWEGMLLRTEGGIQYWDIEIFPYGMGMMTTPGAGMESMMRWVEMTLMWDPVSQTGQIIKFEHTGMNLLFTGWSGTIWFNPVYHFQFGGHGIGTFNDSGTLYPCEIWGSFNGTYYPDDPANPFVLGFSNFTELATLKWGPLPVGGSLVSVDKMAVLSPYLALLVLVAAVSVTAAFVIRRRLLY